MHKPSRRSSRTVVVSVTVAATALLGLSACDGTPHPTAIGGVAPTSARPATDPAAPTGVGTHPTPTSGRSLAGAAAGVGAAAQQLGGEQDEPFLDEGDLTEAERSYPNDQHVYGNVIAVDGLSLRSGWFAPTNRWSTATRPPSTIETGSAKRAEVSGVRPGMLMTYQIVDGAGGPTNYWVGAKFYEPTVRAAEWDCKIYIDGDPRTDGSPTTLSPYACTWGNPHGWNPHPGLTVGKAAVVTNKTKAKQLLTKYCGVETGSRDCTFIPAGYSTTLGPMVLASEFVHNTKDEHGEFKVTWVDERSEENSIEVELGTEIEIWKIWKISLSVKYGHTWETSHKFAQELTTPVEGQGVAWYTHAALMQTTVGTWVVNGDQRYSIPNVSLSAPVETGGMLEIHGCKWTKFNLQEKTCLEGETTKLVPLR
ncbi:MAG: hypothetical protein ABI112_10740 [Terracoccus sp.]